MSQTKSLYLYFFNNFFQQGTNLVSSTKGFVKTSEVSFLKHWGFPNFIHSSQCVQIQILEKITVWTMWILLTDFEWVDWLLNPELNSTMKHSFRKLDTWWHVNLVQRVTEKWIMIQLLHYQSLALETVTDVDMIIKHLEMNWESVVAGGNKMTPASFLRHKLIMWQQMATQSYEGSGNPQHHIWQITVQITKHSHQRTPTTTVQSVSV